MIFLPSFGLLRTSKRNLSVTEPNHWGTSQTHHSFFSNNLITNETKTKVNLPQFIANMTDHTSHIFIVYIYITVIQVRVTAHSQTLTGSPLGYKDRLLKHLNVI